MELTVGKVFRHPTDGLIYITDGAMWVDGRLSNFWYWKKIDENGALVRGAHHGYGGPWPHVKDASIKITVTIPKKRAIAKPKEPLT